MGESLNPSVLSRLVHDWRPDWTRTVAARRVAAGALVVLAAVAAFRSDPHGDQTAIVVAARDLSPGIELTVADVRLETRMAATVPDGSQSAVEKVVGSTLAGPARRGEVLTDVRLLGPRLAQSAAGPDARIVPLHLADTALLDLVRAGDVVDVLAAPEGDVQDATPMVVATDAIVVLVSEKPTGPGAGGDRVLLVALPAHAANDVAGATLMQAVTLTFH
jgi:Flp pilus assembly protein CpaB